MNIEILLYSLIGMLVMLVAAVSVLGYLVYTSRKEMIQELNSKKNATKKITDEIEKVAKDYEINENPEILSSFNLENLDLGGLDTGLLANLIDNKGLISEIVGSMLENSSLLETLETSFKIPQAAARPILIHLLATAWRVLDGAVTDKVIGRPKQIKAKNEDIRLPYFKNKKLSDSF